MPIFCLYYLARIMAGKHAQLEDIIAPVVEGQGCVFWGMNYFAQGRKSLLRVYIDKPEGVTVNDCERVSRQVSSVLDVEDLISGEYILEVSSPGMDRPLFTLEQYRAHVGQQLAVKLRTGLEGRKKFSGLLKGIENDEIVLEVANEEYLLPFELIDKANIVPAF